MMTARLAAGAAGAAGVSAAVVGGARGVARRGLGAERTRSLLALALGLALATGCGYQVGFRAEDGVDTVAVPIFENLTGPSSGGSRRELEIDLTRAVVRELQRRTPLRVRGGPPADVVIYGALTRVQESAVVEGGDDELLRSSARFEVRVRLVREGRPDREALLAEVAEFAAGSGALGTPVEALEPAADEAFRKLAERIVMLLEG